MSSELLTWAEHYLKARDAFERKMVSMDRTNDRLLVKYKNRELTVFGRDILNPDGVASGNVLLVTLQTPVNFKALVADFASYAENPDLTVVFVNPKLNEKWIVKPHVHAAVADKSTLKMGLQALYDTVPAA